MSKADEILLIYVMSLIIVAVCLCIISFKGRKREIEFIKRLKEEVDKIYDENV